MRGYRRAANLMAVGVAITLAACGELPRRDAPAPATPTPAPMPEPPAPPTARLDLVPVTFDQLPNWYTDRHGDAAGAFFRSCQRFAPQPDDRPLRGGLPGTIGDWKAPCEALRALRVGDHAAARAFFETWFRPFKAIADGSPTGLFTGYYEAELRGSWRRGGRFQVPLHRRPDDMITIDLGQFRDDLDGTTLVGRVEGNRLKPYHDRAAIEAGALAQRDLELLWVDDRIDAFTLHIQGSGRVKMPDGRYVRVGYAGKNGHPYRSVGRELVRRGELTLDQASMQSIRSWIERHPDEADRLMAHNPRYIFFKVVEGEGPIGAQGAPLTPGRSMAVDRKFVPLGTPIWLDLPYRGVPDDRIRQLVIAQDVGGAIKGPIRGDFFWGFGDEAAAFAGRMKSRGGYYLLLPATVARRLTATAALPRGTATTR